MTKEQIILISENIRRFSLTMPDNTVEDREGFWSMCEKAINTIAKNNEVLDLVSDRDVFSDLRQLGLSSEQCSIVGAYIKSL